MKSLLLYPVTAYAQTVTVIAFNAENLFDTADDPDNPRDDTYPPLAVKDSRRPQGDRDCEQLNTGSAFFIEQCKTLDWNDEVYATKLQRFADVIMTMPSLPDVIVIPATELNL